MTFDPEKHHRQSMRLKGYDYSRESAYFVTICTDRGKPWLGHIENGVMRPNQFGQVVEDEWLRIPLIRPNVELDEHAIMPDHFHGIIVIARRVGASQRLAQDSSAPTEKERSKSTTARLSVATLGSIIAQFKSRVSKRIFEATGGKTMVWQRGYHDHIICNELDLNEKRRYITNNPMKWEVNEHGFLK